MCEQKKTPLFDTHVALGARIVDFSGWEMPLQYSKVVEEHQAVRSAAGLFDISHMGLVILHAGDSPEPVSEFLDGLVPQDLTKLYPGKAVYTQFLNDAGGIIDDLIIYKLPEQLNHFPEFKNFLVICNAGNTKTDIDWMKQHQPSGIQLSFVSDRYCLFALQGPKFEAVLAKAGADVSQLPKRFHIAENRIADIPVLFARTGYTGEDGVEIIVAKDHAAALWTQLLAEGKPDGLLPIGLAARDTLRLEAAYPLHGHDISENDTPLEAGLGWSVKLEKERDFIGKAALVRQKAEGLPRKFYCFRLTKKSIPRQHDAIFKNGEVVGEVTSGSISPVLNEPVGMGYIKNGIVTGPGDMIQIRIRGNDIGAEIVERPFYKA